MNIKSKLIILYIVLLIISLIQFLSINLLAQDITINVTAEENENSGSSVVIFDQQDFEESQKTTLFEFLQSQSFLYIAEGVDEAEIGFLVLRGFSTSRIAIFLDGIPISLAQINALKLPLNIINKIAIYKGNVSALFGPNAIGGAILIWTKGKESGAINFGSIYFSSLINTGGFFHFSYFNNKIFSTFDIQTKYNSNSYNDSFGKSDFYDLFSRFTFQYDLLNFSFFLDYSKKYLPNSIQFPYFSTFKNSFSLITYLKIKDFMIAFQYINEIFTCQDYTYNVLEERQLFYGFLNYPFIIFNKNNALLNLNLNFRFEYLNDETLTYKNIYDFLFSFSLNFIYTFNNNFDIDLSSSLDTNVKYANEFDYDCLPSFFLQLNKKFILEKNNFIKIFLKTGTGYRLPSFQELYSYYGIIAVGNPDLKPEKSIGLELGVTYKGTLIEVEFGSYYYFFNDFIVWLRRFDNRYKPLNFAKGYNWGIDLSISYSLPLCEEFYIDFSLMSSITISKITEGLLISNEVYVPYIPLINLIFSIDLIRVEFFKLKTELVYRGIRYITIENYNWFSPYFLINLAFTYSISEKQNISFSIENLLGTTYYDLLYYPKSNLILNLDFSFYF